MHPSAESAARAYDEEQNGRVPPIRRVYKVYNNIIYYAHSRRPKFVEARIIPPPYYIIYKSTRNIIINRQRARVYPIIDFTLYVEYNIIVYSYTERSRYKNVKNIHRLYNFAFIRSVYIGTI